MHLDELRGILISERETGRLLAIPHDLYESTRAELECLLTEVYANEDPFSEKARILIERVSSIRETLQDLFLLRTEKVLALSRTHGEGQHVDRDEIKRMLTDEQELFDAVVLAIGLCRCRLIPPSTAGRPGHGVVTEPPGESCTTILAAAAVPPDCVLSRVLADMEPFMGVDGRIYQLQQEDIVTLPARNAEVLCERNIVMSIPGLNPPA